MKKYLNNKLLLIAGSVVILLSACKKEENQVYYQSGTAPVLTANLTDTIPLVAVDSLDQAISFSWTNPNYQFSNGISSQNVFYNLEFDTLGDNFSTPALIYTNQVSPDLGVTFTEKQLNIILASDMSLALSQPHNFQVRVVSFLGANQVALTSNVLNFTATPFAPPPKIVPPSFYNENPSGNLYIVGAAVSNWDNPIDAANVTTQTFTELSPTHYTISIALIGGAEYKLIGKNGSWSPEQWSVATTDTEPNGGPFVLNGNNCIAPAVSGTYTIDVNFQTGIFTVTAQ